MIRSKIFKGEYIVNSGLCQLNEQRRDESVGTGERGSEQKKGVWPLWMDVECEWFMSGL